VTADPARGRGTGVAVWALLVGNFMIGTGVQLPVGLLDLIAADLGVTVRQAGAILLVGGLVVGLGAPLLAWATSRIDRRTLLAGSLALYAACHLATAIAPSLTVVVLLRAVTMVGAAIFTPQAASTVGLMVPPERRAATIATVFLGWSLATVAGLPLGRVLGDLIGWNAAYAIVGVASAAGAAFVWAAVPRALVAPPVSLAVWRQVFGSPVLMAVLAVTLLSMSGQFATFAFAAPIMTQAFAIAPSHVAPIFAVAGLAGVVGTWASARVVGRLGIERSIHVALAVVIFGAGATFLGWGWAPVYVAGAMCTGFGGFASNSLQQSRLVALAPPLAAATVALNTSAVYLGQAVGSGAGSLFMDGGPSRGIAGAALAFVALALAVSLAVSRPRRA
jgi:DHA1 family inner membrane transport protein